MSASILPDSAIQPLLDMTKKISHSSSYKTKLSMLEYIQVKHDFFLKIKKCILFLFYIVFNSFQVAVFTNFPKVVENPGHRAEVQNQVLHLLQVQSRGLYLFLVQNRCLYLHQVQSRGLYLIQVQSRGLNLIQIQSRGLNLI